jgi:CLIP-associating protein 1/2
LALVHIRRAHHQFPIRPYLPLLVDCLEDTDAHVRDCARQSVVELFSGPAVSDGARADLKKEMTKKGVRKAIVDGVLSKLLSASVGGGHSRDNSENGDTAAAAAAAKSKEYVPPSLALMSRKPSQGSGLTRTASDGSVKDMLSRPASRTAMAPSPVPTSTPTTENAEIKPVYVSRLPPLRVAILHNL